MATSNVGQGGVQVIPGSTQTQYPQWMGFYYAIVSSNADPLNLARVQCRVPQVLGTEISAWAWSLLTEADMTLAGQASTTAAATGTGTGTTSGSGTGATTGSTSGSGTATAGTSATSQTATGAAAGTGTTITITPPAVGSVVLITFLGGDLSNPAYLLLYNSTVAGTATSNTTSGTTANANAAGGSSTTTTGGQPSVTTSTLSNALAGSTFSQTVATSGGYPPYTYAVSSGSLPSGTSLSSTSGRISGTPTTAGTSSFTIQSTDSVGNVCTKALTIKTLKTMSITNSPLATGTVGTPYTTTLTATGGTGTGYTWSVCGGAWHPWASLAPSTGVLSGTPTIVATMTFTVKVTDSAGNWATQVFSLTTHT